MGFFLGRAGDGTPRSYLVVYVFGVLVGSVVRVGLFLLPSAAVESLRGRLLPRDPSGQAADGPTNSK